MSTSKIISQQPLLVLKGITADLEKLLEQNLVFEEPKEEMRKNLFIVFGVKPLLHNPARLYVHILLDVTCSRKEQLTAKDIGDLINEARVCLTSLIGIFNEAEKEAAKKMYLSKKHLHHAIRNSPILIKTQIKRPELLRFATRALRLQEIHRN
jgi:hypothetical protein